MKKNTDQKFYNITLALAGIFQSSRLVSTLARDGMMDETAFAATISSIYKTDAESVTAVYGNVANLRLGLTELLHVFNTDKTISDPYVTRYVISLMHLERKLMKNQEMLKILARRVKYANSQAVYFSETHTTVLASLADIYLSTLGTLPFRIQVFGQAKFLNQPEIIHKVRALMLAGVRSVVLWRQIGGSRLQMLLQRHKFTKVAQEILCGLR